VVSFTPAGFPPGEGAPGAYWLGSWVSPRTGQVDAVKQLYKEGSIRNIYRGTFATLLRDVPSSGICFMTYELVQRILTQIQKMVI
jgi:hypothetical protein